jgi:hypothetical protein
MRAILSKNLFKFWNVGWGIRPKSKVICGMEVTVCSAVPSGLVIFLGSLPSVETLGYFRSSLWDCGNCGAKFGLRHQCLAAALKG